MSSDVISSRSVISVSSDDGDEDFLDLSSACTLDDDVSWLVIVCPKPTAAGICLLVGCRLVNIYDELCFWLIQLLPHWFEIVAWANVCEFILK